MTNLPKVPYEHQKLLPQLPWEDMFFFEEKDNLIENFSITENFLTKVRKIFDQYSKKLWKFFLQKSNFPEFFFTLILQFWQSFWSFCTAKMPEDFPHSPKTVRKLIHFCRKDSPIKNLHWTHRMQFWQSCRKVFAESPKRLFPKSRNKETIQKICFQKTTIPKISPGHLKTVLTTQQNFYRQKSEMFSSKSENSWKVWKFREKEKYIFKDVLWTQRDQFWSPCQKIFSKFRTFALKVR